MTTPKRHTKLNMSIDRFTIKSARLITGGDVSCRVSKLSATSFNLSPTMCKSGARLSAIPNSVCSQCYAKRGAFLYNTVSRGLINNTQHVNENMKNKDHREDWIEAIVFLIGKRNTNGLHRWHASGDIQSTNHLKALISVAKHPNMQGIKFWLPTKEVRIVKNYKGPIPPNLVIRLSASMIDGKPPKTNRYNSSSVHQYKAPIGYECKAHLNNGKCGSCTACWNSVIKNVSYKKH